MSPQDGEDGGGDEARVESLLRQLKEQPQHKARAIGEYERWFMEKKPKYSEEIMVLLLVGHENDGLIFEIGSCAYDESAIVPAACALRLLRKLTSVEFTDSLAYRQCLRSTQPMIYLKAMHLHSLLKHDYARSACALRGMGGYGFVCVCVCFESAAVRCVLRVPQTPTVLHQHTTAGVCSGITTHGCPCVVV
eukprot:GHVQ01008313.1.p1 GENE.GHVQ01008313.1~~GHVQ01008313.1.p1  ORF type:complete len:192 (+),score=29.34 GHVQ01008313.1:35-610(+)